MINYEDTIQIINLVDSGVIMLDENQKIVFWNDFVAKTSQLQLGSIKGKHWLDIFPSLNETRIQKAVDKAVNLNFPSILSHKLLKTQFPLYKKSLATKPPYLLLQSLIVKPLLDGFNNKGCIIYINDVSASSKREKDLNQQSIELKDALEKFKAVKNEFAQVFEYAHNAIIVFDITGKIVNTNKEAAILFNCEADTFKELSIDQCLPDIKKIYFKENEQRYSYSECDEHQFEQYLPYPLDKHLSVSVSQIGQGENDENFFVFITDISTEKRTEKELLSANAELEEFAYRTSHDLRSPIVSSLGLMKIAKDSLTKGDTDKVMTCINHANNSLSKLEALIKDILQLSEVNNSDDKEQDTDVSEIIDQAFQSISQLDGFSEIEKNVDLEVKNILQINPIRFSLIVENLISNAVKYQNPKESNKHIKIKTYSDPNGFTFEISDNGLGIPKDQTNKLFQMFNRFHPKQAFGSGIGLYLAKKSANSLGGNIEFINQDKGACFRLSLPQSQNLQ
jgi:PAS domain S-box-containing protein